MVVNNNNNVPNPVMVVYTGQDITTIPRNVTHLVVASNVTTIEAFAFCQCHNLVSVDFHIGLEVIAEFAFGYCTSLEKVRLPSSMRVVGRNVFTRCTRLKIVELNEGLLMLRDGVFSFCLSLKRLRIPSTVVEIEREMVFSCSALETLELPPNNTIRSIEEQAMCGCNMLKSLALPSSNNGQNNTITFGVNIFADCSHLEEQVRRSVDQELSGATAEGSDLLVTFFQQRFDQLPIHELCYYQTFRPVFKTIGRIESLLFQDGLEQHRLVKEGKYHQCPTDLFQMTPFHILALSSKPNYHLLVALQRIYPLCAQYEKDINGLTPIEYILDNMNTSSSLEASGGVLQCLIQSTVLDRLQQQGWSYPKHQQEIGRQVEILYQASEPDERKTTLRNIYTRLSRVERHEGLSVLEFSIWKAKIKAVNQSLGLELLGPTQSIHLSDDDDEENSNNFAEEGNRTTKRARIYSDDPILDRQACRVNCGAGVIIGNVLPFLPPLF